MDAARLAAEAAKSGQVSTTSNFNMTGNNMKNYGANYGAGVGLPVVHNGPDKPSVGVGATVSGGFGAVNGHKFSGKPDYGVGMNVRFPF